MSYSEVLEERGDLRVRLVALDEDIPPEQDGEPPLLRVERGSVSFARDGGTTENKVSEAFVRWCYRPCDAGWHYFERYMRAYMGVTVIQPWLSENGNWYVAYDTPEWREAAGITEDQRAALADQDLIGDWKPYTDGDVWGYVVEKRVTWTAPGYNDRDSWEDADVDGQAPVWGLYGRDYAEKEARAAFAEAAGE